MCLRKSLKSFVLLLLLLVAPSSYCFSDVVLTDKEAQELMNEIQKSEMELENVKNELSQSQVELTEQATQLQDVKNTYEEQKKSYEKQLKKAKSENFLWKMIAFINSAITVFVSLFSIF